MIQYTIQGVLFAVSVVLLIIGFGVAQGGVTADTYQTRIGYAIVGVGVVFAIFAIFWPGKDRRNPD